MSYMHPILLAIFIVYSASMLLLIIGWVLATRRKIPNLNEDVCNKFSVLIPFRNEEENIKPLINSLSTLDYPTEAVEFIFINDHSTDNGKEYLEDLLFNFPFPSQIINLSLDTEGKKNAITRGVLASRYSNIVTTDADCVFSSNWLLSINNSIHKDDYFIVGAVINEKKSGILANLQQIEALMLAGTTIGSAFLTKPLLCSGANLSYSKSLFEELNPYKDNLDVLSGDDMFFLEKVAKNSMEVTVNDGSVVETKGANSLNTMLSRSIRWASKSSKLNLFWSSVFSAIVLITNYSMLFILLMFFFTEDSIVFFVKLCSIKTIFDVLFLILLANRYNRYEAILYFPLMAVFYPFYLLVVSIASVFTSSKWEGR